jgi:hypothetical protein
MSTAVCPTVRDSVVAGCMPQISKLDIEPIKSSVAGDEHRARIVLPNGFEYREVEIGHTVASRVRTGAQLTFQHQTTHAGLELVTPEARMRLAAWLEEAMAAPQQMRQIFVRMPDDLIERLDRYVERMRREQLGSTPTRSDAIRVLLYRALTAVEPEGESRRGNSIPT